MRIVLCYPPATYPYMPYLAPFLIKGYLKATRPHEVRTHDLNIEFHLHLWGRDFGLEAIRELDGAADQGTLLAAELLAEKGRDSWNALRSSSTMSDLEAVRAHATLLKEASRLALRVDHHRGAAGLLPDRLGAWPGLLDRLAESVAGRYIDRRVTEGLYGDADLVGITLAYIEQVGPGLLLARALRRRRPDVKIAVGGGAVTHLLPELARDASFYTDVDCAVPFEGEHSLVEITDAIDAGSTLPEKNVARLDGTTVRYRQDLASRPQVQAVPDFDDLDHLYPTPRPIYPLLTSKGCYWGKCRFCTHHEGYGQGYYRLKDDLVEATIRRLIDQRGADCAFYFVDEALPPRKIGDFVRLFASIRKASPEGTGPFWMAEARLEKTLVTPEAVDLLARSGCRLLVNGIESGSQRIVDRMAKGVDLDLVSRHAELCDRVGVRTGWMFFIGFPGETELEARQTFEFIQRNARHVDYASVGTFGLERGAPVWLDPASAGVARIHDADSPYRLDFEFDLADGTRYTKRAIGDRLRRLHTDFPELRPVFADAVDRALALFFPPKPPPDSRVAAPLSGGYIHRWRSRIAEGEAALDFREGKVEISREPAG